MKTLHAVRHQAIWIFSLIAFVAGFQFLLNAQENTDAAEKGTAAKTDPEAKELLDRVNKAYDNLKTVEMSGEVSVNIAVAGETEKTNQQFTSSFQAPDKFRHESKGGFTLGSTGDKVYVFNEKANSYLWLDPIKESGSVRDLPIVLPQILQTQNPSLLFALTTNPVDEVMLTFDQAKKLDDVKLDGKSFLAVQLVSSKDGGQLKLVIDPDTHLIRQFSVDFKSALEQGGTEDVRSATVVVDYPTINTQPKFEAQHFAWTPPKGAFDMREAAGAQREEKPAASALEDKHAPDFTLNTLQGEEVSLDDLKGNVVVLDFWATWCPPCVKSLPELAQLHNEMKDEGVKVYAVNLQEQKDKVQTFLEVKRISIPVLLDEKGEIAKRYQVRSIPQTVVIGKDGRVKKVFIGFGPDTEEELRAAVEAAQKEQVRR